MKYQFLILACFMECLSLGVRGTGESGETGDTDETGGTAGAVSWSLTTGR